MHDDEAGKAMVARYELRLGTNPSLLAEHTEVIVNGAPSRPWPWNPGTRSYGLRPMGIARKKA